MFEHPALDEQAGAVQRSVGVASGGVANFDYASGFVDDGQSDLAGSALHVQMRESGAGSANDNEVHGAAARGMDTPSASLPFGAEIARSFGPAFAGQVGGIEAHLGGDAGAACDDMGAQAFAAGNHVAFKGAPDLHTAAHEAAHVVQQAQGVNLYGGVGAAGDAYEQHADAVADRVVAGESAADLLSRGGPAGGGGGGVQRKESHHSPSKAQRWEAKHAPAQSASGAALGTELQILAVEMYQAKDTFWEDIQPLLAMKDQFAELERRVKRQRDRLQRAETPGEILDWQAAETKLTSDRERASNHYSHMNDAAMTTIKNVAVRISVKVSQIQFYATDSKLGHQESLAKGASGVLSVLSGNGGFKDAAAALNWQPAALIHAEQQVVEFMERFQLEKQSLSAGDLRDPNKQLPAQAAHQHLDAAEAQAEHAASAVRTFLADKDEVAFAQADSAVSALEHHLAAADSYLAELDAGDKLTFKQKLARVRAQVDKLGKKRVTNEYLEEKISRCVGHTSTLDFVVGLG